MQQSFDLRKACYHQVLNLWRDLWNMHPKRRPMYTAFDLTASEAVQVEQQFLSANGLENDEKALNALAAEPVAVPQTDDDSDAPTKETD